MPGQNPQALHKQLIKKACEIAGWKADTQRRGWRPTMRTMLSDPRWADERDEIIEFIDAMDARPDAWRISIRDEDSMLFLEFLEVEVSHHISEEKKEIYLEFWWRIDGSDGVRLQIWRMDRFGIISPFMTEDTIHTFDDVLSE